MKRIPNIVLAIVVLGGIAGVMPSPGAGAQQTVTAAAQPLVAYPKPASLLAGYDTYCAPYFFRSTISGKDRVGFSVGSSSNQPDPLFADVKVIRGNGPTPSARPLDGDWTTAQRWVLILPQDEYDRSAKCLPAISPQ